MYECDDGPARARARAGAVTVTPTPTFFRPAASAIGELWCAGAGLAGACGPVECYSFFFEQLLGSWLVFTRHGPYPKPVI
jgi:hypothetical protein